MHQKLLMNGLIIDHENIDIDHLILKEFILLSTKQRARHSLTRYTYFSTGPNQTWHIDGYDKLKPFGFAIHGAIDGYIQKFYGCL